MGEALSWRHILTVTGGLVSGLIPFLLYLRTLAPGVMYYARPNLLDAATLQVHAITLGITHPTGYPGWVMLTHLFTYLPFGNPAYLTNLSSAVYAAAAVVFVYACGILLTRRVAAAATGALAFGLGATLWSQAVITEVYTMNALFIALDLFVLLLWRRAAREGDNSGDGYLFLAAFLFGLSLTDHLTSGALIPAGVAFVALVDPSRLKEPRLWAKGTGLFLLGLAPYLYLPIRASMKPPFREGNPDTVAGFLNEVTGRQVNGLILGRHIWELPDRLAMFAGNLWAQFGVLLALAALGAAVLVIRDRPAAVLLGIPFFLWLAHASIYDIPDLDIYFVSPFLVVALCVCAGAGSLLRFFEARIIGGNASGEPRLAGFVAVPLVSAAILFLPFAGVAGTYASVDRSDDHHGREIIEAVANNVEPGATVLHNRSSLWYMVLVEKRRRDLTLLDPFIPPRITTYDLVWPDNLPPGKAQKRYSTGDSLGVATARRAVGRGPVYILDQDSVNAPAFRQAGFDMVPVVPGILYRLVLSDKHDGAG